MHIEGCDPKSLKGQNVILVEDLIDTGNTMQALLPYLESFGAKSVSVRLRSWM